MNKELDIEALAENYFKSKGCVFESPELKMNALNDFICGFQASRLEFYKENKASLSSKEEVSWDEVFK